MWSVALWVLASVAGARTYPDPLWPVEIACLGERTVVGLSEDSHLIHYDGTKWHQSALAERTSAFWRAPDGRLFTWTWGEVAELREPTSVATRWRLPQEGPVRVLMLKNDLFAASVRGLRKLEPAGAVTFEGVTPLNPLAERPRTPPVLLDGDPGMIICTGSSATEATRIRGHCLGPPGRRYSYRAEFGLLPWPDEGHGTDPFLCGDVVISARKQGTQARRASDGIQVGRAGVYALPGSQCLSDQRVFLAGRREVGVFQLPGLHPVWRRPLKGQIRDVALCGGAVAVLSPSSATLTTIEIPREVLGK